MKGCRLTASWVDTIILRTRAFVLFSALVAPCAAYSQSSVQFTDSGQKLGGDASSYDVALGDVDGDGDLDAVVASESAAGQLWINQGGAQGGTPGVFLDSGQILAPGYSLSVALGDLDDDNDLDAFFLDDTFSAANQVWINQGGMQGGTAGTFLHNGQIIGEQLSSAVALGNLDGDASLDAFVARNAGRSDKVWTNNGAALFADSGQTLGGDSGTDVALGDLDGDGDLDAFVVNGAANKVWLNQGGAQGGTQGIFLDSGQSLGSSLSVRVALADLDGDGDLDAFVAEAGPDTVWINQGRAQAGVEGTFADSGQALGSVRTQGVALADLDGDGDIDAFIVGYAGILVYVNDGSGGFTNSGLTLDSFSGEGVALGDLDGDGDIDAFVANVYAPDEVWINGPLVPEAPQYIIDTFAGNGTQGHAGDGGPAVLAQLAGALDVAADAQGNVYIADGDRVRKVSPDGMINLFAGTGEAGFGGDGGPATAARLSGFLSVESDAAGNVYIADSGNHRIRRVDAQGIITTVAGSDGFGFAGDNGPATNALLDAPSLVAVGAGGTLLIADDGNHRIRRVDADGIITTVAGNGHAGVSGDGGSALDAPLDAVKGLAVDPLGNIYLTTLSDDKIRRITPDGTISTFAGTGMLGLSGNGGAATNAQLQFPRGIAVDNAGNVFVSESRRVRRIDVNGIISAIAGNGTVNCLTDGEFALEVGLCTPRGLAVDDAGNLYVAGDDGRKVRRLSPTGVSLPLLPRFVSTPSKGSIIDLGRIGANDVNDPDPPLVPHELTRSLIVGNGGSADLRIESVRFVEPGELSIHDAGLTAWPPLSLPRVIPDGYGSQSVAIGIRLEPYTPGEYTKTLEVVSNDPGSPVVHYPIRYFVGESFELTGENILIYLLAVLINPTGGGAAQRPVPLESMPTSLDDPLPVTLRFDTNSPCSLTAEIPSFLGAGTMQISNFTGELMITAAPLFNDLYRLVLTVDEGRFTAPSIQLASGPETGLNIFTFIPGNEGSGILDLSTGEFSLTADAYIRNDLLPQVVQVRGRYTGIYDVETGRAMVESQSTDLITIHDRLDIVQSAGNWWLLWMQGELEQATNVLGPWTTVTNAVSPHPLDAQRRGQQFFRTRHSLP